MTDDDWTGPSITREFEAAASERAEMRRRLRRDRIVNLTLYALAFVGIVLSVGAITQVYSLGEQNTELIARVQDSREQRVREQAEADLVICARTNYQDARDKLQDQLLRDLVAVPSLVAEERRTLFAAAVRQLERRLATQPPDVADLLKRWRGNPVPDRVEREREREAAGVAARAEARDRNDRIQLPVDCDELPSQRRPFTR